MTFPRRATAALALAAAIAGGCEQNPDLVGHVVQETASVAGTNGGASDAGPPGEPPEPDAGGTDCAEPRFSSPFGALASVIVQLGCQFPYSWITSGPPPNVIDATALQDFLDQAQPPPPRPGAMLEDACGWWGGFYPDDADNPTAIILCPVACTFLMGVANDETRRWVQACEQGSADEDAGS